MWSDFFSFIKSLLIQEEKHPIYLLMRDSSQKPQYLFKLFLKRLIVFMIFSSCFLVLLKGEPFFNQYDILYLFHIINKFLLSLCSLIMFSYFIKEFLPYSILRNATKRELHIIKENDKDNYKSIIKETQYMTLILHIYKGCLAILVFSAITIPYIHFSLYSNLYNLFEQLPYLLMMSFALSFLLSRLDSLEYKGKCELVQIHNAIENNAKMNALKWNDNFIFITEKKTYLIFDSQSNKYLEFKITINDLFNQIINVTYKIINKYKESISQ